MKRKLVYLPLHTDKAEYTAKGLENSLLAAVTSPWLTRCVTLPACQLVCSHQISYDSYFSHIKTNVLGQGQHKESFHHDENTRPSAFHSWPDMDSEWK